ncbi:hypothetical protein Tco_1367508 [Tanacetum coccineum]
MKFVKQPIGPAPDPETADPDTIDKYYKTVNLEQEVACIMLSSMSPDLQRTLEKYNAYEMMKEIKTMFEEQAKQELIETVKAFHACKQEEGQLVSSYLLKMKSYLDTLERLGYALPNELGVSLILNSLNKEYDQFVQNYNMHSMGKMIAELHAMLILHEKGIPKKSETPAVLAIREGKIQKDKKKLQGAKGKNKGKNKRSYAPKAKISPPPKRDNPIIVEQWLNPAEKRAHWCEALSQEKEGLHKYWASCDPHNDICDGGSLPNNVERRYWESTNDNERVDLEWKEYSFNNWVRKKFSKVYKMTKDRILEDYWRKVFNEAELENEKKVDSKEYGESKTNAIL